MFYSSHAPGNCIVVNNKVSGAILVSDHYGYLAPSGARAQGKIFIGTIFEISLFLYIPSHMKLDRFIQQQLTIIY